MTSLPLDPAVPRFLLALDLPALEAQGIGRLQRLGDRIAAVRRGTALVFIGDDGHPDLPAPDYVVDPSGRRILRMPAGEALDGWPPATGETGPLAAVLRLAEELLVPPSEVFFVLGPALAGEVGPARMIVVDGERRPARGLWLAEPTEDRLIDALEEVQLLGRGTPSPADLCEDAFAAALESVRRNVVASGFTAASVTDNALGTHDANYAAVWARDGVITGLWTLPLEAPDLVDAFERTIRTLAAHQTPSGQIPTSVSLDGDRPDYSGLGGIAGVDSVLWFVIGAVRLVFQRRSRALAEELGGVVERAMGWLAAHDSNDDGLIEIPESSDWMDLFPRSYNVLYDEVLWYQACRDTAVLLDALGGDGAPWRAQADRVGSAITRLFWPTGDQIVEIAGGTSGRFGAGEASYLLSQITPFDYGWRCDVYANLLAALTGLLGEARRERLFVFLWGVGVNSPFPVACLYPSIPSGADDWKDYFLVNFLNLPDHYHNGGIWPYIGGLWVRFLVRLGRVELAHRELLGLAEACRQGIRGEWEFNEWLHGRTGRPMGKAHQAWSAASYIHAYLTLRRGAPVEAFPELDVDGLE